MNNQLLTMIRQSEQLCFILDIIESLNLKDGCLCAGTIRNFVWDHIYQTSTDTTDIDVIYFDESSKYEDALVIEKSLNLKYPMYHWEVRNQVYMHLHNPNTDAYKSIEDALAHFPEICTAVAIYKENNQLHLIAPYGVDDILNGVVRPTPYFDTNSDKHSIYFERVNNKNWSTKWPLLTIYK